jgi:hypothetical protein
VQGDPRLVGANAALGGLFADFYADSWVWGLVETIQKLVLTGILGFVAPGTQGQVVTGVGITFLMLLAYQKAQPYAEKAHRHVGYAAAIELFLFFTLGLWIKAGVVVTPDNDAFFSASIGVLCCCVFSLPVVIIVRRLRWSLDDDEEEEDDCASPTHLAALEDTPAGGPAQPMIVAPVGLPDDFSSLWIEVSRLPVR